MISIGYSPDIFCTQPYGGISRYFVALWSALKSDADLRPQIHAPLYTNNYLREAGFQRGLHVPVSFAKITLPVRRVSRSFTNILTTISKPDIIHETYYYREKWGLAKIARIITVYDMIHELNPLYFAADDDTSTRKREAVKRADHVICISQRTQYDLCRLFDVPLEKTSVVYLGYDLPHAVRTVDARISTRPYLLYVGGRGKYKNFHLLLEALSALLKAGLEIGLLCFGGGSFREEEVEFIRALGFSERDIVQRDGTDDDLTLAYRNASILVYPSLYEGFGIPPLEAMSCGCPVICSNGGSLPEVVGNAALIFEANSVDALKAAMMDLITSDTLRTSLVNLGYIHAKTFSWRKCAAETALVYKRFV